MHHLGQEEFLQRFKDWDTECLFVIAEDMDWLDLVKGSWSQPPDWCCFDQDGKIVIRREENLEEKLRQYRKKKLQLECDGDYIWGENCIQEFYHRRAEKALLHLQKEAEARGFHLEMQDNEIRFEGEGKVGDLYHQAAQLIGKIRKESILEEESLAKFRNQAIQQLGDKEWQFGEPFLLSKCKAWQQYRPQKPLFNWAEDGRLHAGQLAESGVLVIALPDILQDGKAYSYLKRVLEEKMLSDWGIGDHLTEQPLEDKEIDPMPYDGHIIFYGTMEWLMLWEQADPMLAQSVQKLHWKSQCRLDEKVRREFRECLGPCTLRDEKILLNYMRRGAASGYVWTDVDKLAGMRNNPEQSVEDRLKEEEKWWEKPRRLSARGVGEINGMAILSILNCQIGSPVTIQAVCRRKRKRNRSLENLSGPIYQKGMEILKEYWESLGSSKQFTLLLERNYNYLEGDSATISQLYAVLSAAARWAPKSGIAVTGSMNLKGAVLAVGGVTEKIEGCYRCGGIGMIFPKENEGDLYLRPSVERAVREGRFHLWPIERVEEGAEILFGKKWSALMRKI